MEKKSVFDRVKGAIIGFMIGDALGATTEFMSKKEIKEEYGVLKKMVGGGWLNLKPGEVTDDTQMCECIMKVILRDKFSSTDELMEQIMKEFYKWYSSNPKDVGRQCSKAICYWRDKREYIPIDENALGNGGLMRAMPLAVLFNGRDLSVMQSKLTHNNDTCSKIVSIYSIMMWMIIHYNYKKEYPENTELLEPTGHVVNTFNNVCYWFAVKNSFVDTIIGAVNNGGDADTIAAITGSLAGAYYGYSSMERDLLAKEWIDTLNSHYIELADEYARFVTYDSFRKQVALMM